jgi:MoaA/NifB/PqqE/SkfB family radical SAM enzyme
MKRLSPLATNASILVEYFVFRRRLPFLASYKLTYSCNLNCRQCPFKSNTTTQPSYAQVCRTLDELYTRGSRMVIFEGGEPLLWCDGEFTLRDVVGYAHQKFFRVGITTNGTLPLDLEPDILWVSIDGLVETHNRLRGAPIFERVIGHIRQSNHPRIYAHITANSENYAEIPALVRFLTPLVRGITIQFYYPYGSADDLFLPWPARRALLDELIALKKAGYPVLNSTAALSALKGNNWRCLPWLVDNANPDGSLFQGCYLHGRADIDCDKCGFSPYTEISLAFRGNPRSILAGMKIFY